MDKDGYPEEHELEKIRLWDWHDPNGWFDYINSIWWMSDWGWHETDEEYQISTGGWSGNEDVIQAMEQNLILWMFTWVQSRRGGHYIFEKKELK